MNQAARGAGGTRSRRADSCPDPRPPDHSPARSSRRGADRRTGHGFRCDALQRLTGAAFSGNIVFSLLHALFDIAIGDRGANAP